MNILDKFRYSKDNPAQLNIVLKGNPYQKRIESNKENLSKLLSTSVKVSKEIFPNIANSLLPTNCYFLILPRNYNI